MKCEHTTVILTFQLLMFVGIASGTLSYRAQFSEDVRSCAGYENEMLQCDSLHLGSVEGKDELGMSGTVKLKHSIEEGDKVLLEIWKIMEIANEIMYHMEYDICSILQDEQTVMYTLFNSMKITKCPIDAGDYHIKDMVIDLNHSKSMMTHELCGQYKIQMMAINTEDTKPKSCHEMEVEVAEYQC